jgi:hypothetical protein
MTEEFLKLISQDDHLVLNHLAGKKTIIKAKDVFYHIDSEFSKYSFKAGVPTPKRTIQVYESVPGTKPTFVEMFASLDGDWSKKWLSQSQITKVCKHFKHWLRGDSYSTYILCNVNEFSYVDEDAPEKSLVVAVISLDYDGDIRINKLNLCDEVKRDGDFLTRVIVPKFRKLKDQD